MCVCDLEHKLGVLHFTSYTEMYGMSNETRAHENRTRVCTSRYLIPVRPHKRSTSKAGGATREIYAKRNRTRQCQKCLISNARIFTAYCAPLSTPHEKPPIYMIPATATRRRAVVLLSVCQALCVRATGANERAPFDRNTLRVLL